MSKRRSLFLLHRLRPIILTTNMWCVPGAATSCAVSCSSVASERKSTIPCRCTCKNVSLISGIVEEICQKQSARQEKSWPYLSFRSCVRTSSYASWLASQNSIAISSPRLACLCCGPILLVVAQQSLTLLRFTHRISRHPGPGKAKGRIGQDIAIDPWDNMIASGLRVFVQQTLLGGPVEPPLDNNPRQVPRNVTGSRKEMVIAVG